MSYYGEVLPANTPIFFDVQTDEQRYNAEVTACAQQLAAGTMPELPNGFRLVFDPVTHDDPYFSGEVPPEQYTWHIAKGEQVMARPGTSMYSHDQTHIPGYQRMLGSATYADIVRIGAFNSLGSLQLCRQFTGAYDGLAVQMALIYQYDGFEKIALARARECLRTIIDHAFMSSAHKGDELLQRKQAVFVELANFFAFAAYEQR